MIKTIKNIFNTNDRKVMRLSQKELDAIKEIQPKIAEMSFEDMAKRVSEIKAEIKKEVDKVPAEARLSIKKINRRGAFPKYEKDVQNKVLEFMPEVYAMVNESYKRKVGYQYHDVQLRAAIILAKGQMLVEQYTGEGKTMTFQLPLALYSLAGRGSHLVTVNDYLTKVGAEYAGHFLNPLGISVGVITPTSSYKFVSDEQAVSYKGEEIKKQLEERAIKIDSMEGLNLVECTKRDAYTCDITYGTNNEFGFDYLRDNMAWDLAKISQGELYFCIIDEADSILIDEARTPLIISSTPTESDVDKYVKYANAVRTLEEGKDYEIDYKTRSVNLTEDGIEHVEAILEVDNLWDDFAAAHYLENALKAKALFIKDDQYVVKNGEILIVDEFTGRILKGRRYSEGLHQAIEAKERVDIKEESKTFATITFQNFFRLYKVLCGGSGTIMTESEEFFKIYGLDAVAIPTNKPRIRIDNPDRIYRTQEAKFSAVVEEIKEMNEIGRPVLVGTTSVEKSELLSNLLDKAGIEHEVLNAKFHEQESRIVTQAGKKGAVTVATNMAGRGTDIVIGGGNRGDKAYQEVAELGGLHVIGTERHDSRRIDNQLRGRTGRQGEPGSTRFYASLDDQIMRILGGEIIARLMSMVKVPDDQPIELNVISRQIEMAQKRVESVNFDSRKRVVEYDDVMNQHREIFYSRRMSYLLTAENALGKFVKDNKVIDLNLHENTDKSKEFEELLNENKAKLEEMMEDLVIEQTIDVIDEYVEESNKINQKVSEKLTKKLTELIPASLLSKGLNTSENKISEVLVKMSEEDHSSLRDKLVSAVEKVFSDKIDHFSGDYYQLIKMVSLENLDKKWVDHLEIMKDVKDSISLQGYAQRDPLVEYKNQAFYMFRSFIQNVNSDITKQLFRLQRTSQAQVPQQVLVTNENEVQDVLTGDREMFASDQSKSVSAAMRQIEQSRNRTSSNLRTNRNDDNKGTKKNILKIGRNDKVSVKYSDGKVVKDVKYKKVEDDVTSGKAIIVK